MMMRPFSFWCADYLTAHSGKLLRWGISDVMPSFRWPIFRCPICDGVVAIETKCAACLKWRSVFDIIGGECRPCRRRIYGSEAELSDITASNSKGRGNPRTNPEYTSERTDDTLEDLLRDMKCPVNKE